MAREKPETIDSLIVFIQNWERYVNTHGKSQSSSKNVSVCYPKPETAKLVRLTDFFIFVCRHDRGCKKTQKYIQSGLFIQVT